MRRVLVLVLAMVLILGVAGPASAAEDPVGDRVNVLAGTPTTYPADTPFHVLHGWGPVPNLTKAVGILGFELDVDGVDMGRGSLLNFGGREQLIRLWLYNFEDGLPAGTYTLTGHWFLPCSDAVSEGLFPGPCATPNEPVEVFTIPLDITFS